MKDESNDRKELVRVSALVGDLDRRMLDALCMAWLIGAAFGMRPPWWWDEVAIRP